MKLLNLYHIFLYLDHDYFGEDSFTDPIRIDENDTIPFEISDGNEFW